MQGLIPRHYNTICYSIMLNREALKLGWLRRINTVHLPLLPSLFPVSFCHEDPVLIFCNPARTDGTVYASDPVRKLDHKGARLYF